MIKKMRKIPGHWSDYQSMYMYLFIYYTKNFCSNYEKEDFLGIEKLSFLMGLQTAKICQMKEKLKTKLFQQKKAVWFLKIKIVIVCAWIRDNFEE